MIKDQKKSSAQYALELLAHYPRTVAEIRSKLLTKEYKEKDIEEALAEMIELGYLDDQEYTQVWLANQLKNRPCGKLLCYKKLKAKGIAPELITKTLASKYPQERELEIANRLAEQKRKYLKVNQRSKNQEAKIAFFLKNKGFTADIIYEVLQLD